MILPRICLIYRDAELLQASAEAVVSKARRGLAFNVMSKQVDWERDDSFHLPMDVFASFSQAISVFQRVPVDLLFLDGLLVSHP